MFSKEINIVGVRKKGRANPIPTPRGNPPRCSVDPVISGVTTLGGVLASTTGTWISTLPITYYYQWQRNGSDIVGAIDPTYTLVNADLSATIVCMVTAANADGIAGRPSNSIVPAGAIPPLVVLALSASTIPEGSINGTVVGAILNKTSGSSLSLSADGGGRFAISGTSIVCTSTPTDFETATSHNITIVETLTGSFGSPKSTTVTITVTDVAEGSLPTISVVPAITGDARVGQYLFSSTGAWTNSPTSYSYQWYVGGTLVPGATLDNYWIQDTDLGSIIRCDVVATNGTGSSSPASSANTSAVANIDLSADAPVLTRTSGNTVTPMTWNTALGSKTYAGYQVTLQTCLDSSFSVIDQECFITLTERQIAGTDPLDWSLATPVYTAISATSYLRMKVWTLSPLGTLSESSWSNSLSPTDAAFSPVGLSLIYFGEPTAGHRYTDSGKTTAAGDGNSLGNVVDQSGSGNDALTTRAGERPVAHDSGGKSWMTFDGTDDALYSASDLFLTDGSGQWSVFGAIKFNSVSGIQHILDGDFPTARVGIFLRLNGGVLESLAFTSGASVAATATGTTSLSTGTWYNIVVVCTTTTLKIYLNGSLEATGSVSGSLQTAANSFGIGGHDARLNGGDSPFNGQISSCGFRPAPSSSTDISNLTTYLAGTHA
jgi:hypothetical protein